MATDSTSGPTTAHNEAEPDPSGDLVRPGRTDGAAAGPDAGRARPVPRALWGTVVAVTVVVGLVVAATWLTVLAQLGSAEDADRAAAIAAARQVVVALTTTTPGGAQASFDQLRELSTGPFGEQLQSQTQSFVSAVQTSAVTSQGSVSASAYVSGDDTSARVLVVSDSVVRNNQVPQGEPRQYRIQLDMVKQADRWLVSNLDFVA